MKTTMDKVKIISKFNSKFKKLQDDFPNLDWMIYSKKNKLFPDPYGGKMDIPIDKFPEWHKWWESKRKLNQDYHEIISKIAKFKKGDMVVIGCENHIEFGKIHNDDFFVNGEDDIKYYINFDKNINPWKYGGTGGYFGNNDCSCGFYEKDILIKVSAEEMKEMKKMSIVELKHIYPALFPCREYDESLDKIKNLVIGFTDKLK